MIHEENTKKRLRTAKEKTIIEAVRPLVVVRGPQVFACKSPMNRTRVSIMRAKKRQTCTFSRIWNLTTRYF